MEFKLNMPKKVIVGENGHEMIDDRFVREMNEMAAHSFEAFIKNVPPVSIINTGIWGGNIYTNNNIEDVEYTDVTNDPRYDEGAKTTNRENADRNPIAIKGE